MNADKSADMNMNRQTWDAWTKLHVDSPFYDVHGFRAGKESLDRIEIEGTGDVRGRTLLHLQCHFGLSTLSFARKGAKVVGVDFSGEAIAEARKLGADLNLEATFVQSNIYDLPKVLDGKFDIVFTSHGVLPWLPDLESWGRVVAHFLKPGGAFFMVEGHPFAMTIDDRPGAKDLSVYYPYFLQSEPWRFEQQGSYAAPNAPVHTVNYEWFHSLSEILGALLRAGLKITSFAEYPFAAWQTFPAMVRREDGLWALPQGMPEIPLSFSVGATKE